MNQTDGMKIAEKGLFQSFKDKYNSHEFILREYKFYEYRIKVALWFIGMALWLFIMDLFWLNESHGLIYWLNMFLFFVFLITGLCVIFSLEVKTKEYKRGVMYHYEYTILGFIPRLSKKENKKNHEFPKSRYKASVSERERIEN